MKIARGIRLDSGSYHVSVRVNGRLYAKRFPIGSAMAILKAWREDKRVALRTGVALPSVDPDLPGFTADVRTYLAIVTSMPSMDDRRRDLENWARVFQHRPRAVITPQMIKAQLERWLASGLAPGTINRRRTALMSLWTELDGKSARNPVRDVPRYDEGHGELRALSHRLIYRILAFMRKTTRRAEADRGWGTRYHRRKTLVRLRVMAWTGWPHKQIKQLKPEHLRLNDAVAYVTPRRKGKGHAGEWLPLLPAAIVALRDFDREDAYGPFSNSAMHSAFQRALFRFNEHRKNLNQRPIQATPYDLRHSFGVLAAALFKDDSVVQRLMLHSSVEQTQRYIRAARGYRLEAALATLATPEGFSRVVESLRSVGETGRMSKKSERARLDLNQGPPA